MERGAGWIGRPKAAPGSGARLCVRLAEVRRPAVAGHFEMRQAIGEGGIRTPGGLRLTGFQDRRLEPLGHLSK